jgi:hypothetical protein
MYPGGDELLPCVDGMKPIVDELGVDEMKRPACMTVA